MTPYTKEDLITLYNMLSGKGLYENSFNAGYVTADMFNPEEFEIRMKNCKNLPVVNRTFQEYLRVAYDIIFIKNLKELPLLINNGDEHAQILIQWRFAVGK